MLRRSAAALIGFLACIAAATAASAQGPGTLTISATTATRGFIGLHLAGSPGAAATISELRQGAAPVTLATVTLPASGALDLPHAAQWACSPSLRRFAVTATAPDGSVQRAATSVRTPSCAHRLSVSLRPARVRVRRTATVRVRDGWRLGGVSARVCHKSPGSRRASCRTVVLRPGHTLGELQLRPRRPGRYSISVRLSGERVRRSLNVRPSGGRLRILATGDSMIQIIDGDLAQRVRRIEPAKVESDAHISTGISKPFMLNWTRHAAASAHSFRPDVTVVFLGANDGFPMPAAHGRVDCCGSGWVKSYAYRVRRMMRSYERHGAGTVYWLLLPAARSSNFQKVFVAVNQALERAAAAAPGAVHLIDLRKVFSPGGRFRQFIRWHGHTLSARQPDGVHLSVAGAAVATDLIVRALRHDHVLSR